MRTVLLLGRTEVVVEDVQRQLDLPDTQLLGGTGIDDVRAAFGRGDVSHVIIGAGLDLETRLQIVQEIFETSEATTVHLKDRTSGPNAFLPFVRAVLLGLQHYNV